MATLPNNEKPTPPGEGFLLYSICNFYGKYFIRQIAWIEFG